MMNLKELCEIYWPQWDSTTGVIFMIILVVLAYGIWRIFNSKKFTICQIISMVALIIYVLLVLFSTVFTRMEEPQFKYNLELFWSYRWGITERGDLMIREIILNTLMLMPIGILMPVIYVNISKKVFLITILLGFVVSGAIEVLQLILKRGLCEFDDLFHNTLGVVIGYFIYWMILKIMLYWRNKKNV